MTGIMNAMVGISNRPTGQGLWLRRYLGYAGANVNWFATQTPFSSVVDPGPISLTVGQVDSQGAEWLGYWFAPTTNTYNFQYSADTYSYLWIGSIARSGFNSSNSILTPSIRSGSISLLGGVYYPMRVQWSFLQTGNPFFIDEFSTLTNGFFAFSYSNSTTPVTQNLNGVTFYNPLTQGF
jgi:hypothetical protein